MAKKGSSIVIVIAFSILVVILYLVTYSDTSPIAESVQWLSFYTEGFASQHTPVASCPPNYRFFNDAKGDSMCCAGGIDPNTHVCLGKGKRDLCSFVPGVTDHRDAKRGLIPSCKDIMRQMQEDAEREFCPRSMPHHASKGKCCVNPTDSITGDCVKRDLERQDGYCLTSAERKERDRGKRIYGNHVVDNNEYRPAEMLCSNIRNKEALQCPAASMNKMEQPFDETLFEGVKRSFLNLCFGAGFGQGFCYPEKELRIIKSKHPQLKNFNVEKSIFNCDVYKRVKIDKDLTFQADYTDGNGNRIGN